ncbi:hypothetical protein EB796_008519 [Bugula neritina]|uniref:Plastocyanin-like domain-containing protein n=1 Tax=Bugula neritina TaxID=10212 RepID=A0A7J7K4S6_BUGNE|nr:hypothetical protein EB796_008519 [Bugula neritina]
MLFSTVQVYIHVHNQLMTDSATIHWHGINMKGINNTISGATPWSDGVPYVTQCPILPGATFTHVFAANEAGTFWYHSHQEMQKMDGLFGALVIYDPSRTHYPSFTVINTDWMQVGATYYASNYNYFNIRTPNYGPIQERYAGVDAPGPYADSHLVNGRGRFNNTAPLEVHRVEQGRVYLFRFINAGFDDEYGVCTMHSESK